MAYNELKKIPNFEDEGFPLMEATTSFVSLFPLEDSADHHGIGFKPVLLDTRKHSDGPFPSSASIKTVSCDMLARAVMPTVKKSKKTWLEAITKADWHSRPSSKEWPSPIVSDEEGSDDNGELSFAI